VTTIVAPADMTATPWKQGMDEDVLTTPEPQTRLEEIIRRMQKIQRSIKASRQPASRLELMELKDLGREYACIIEQLADLTEVGLE
jgi:hypothetical protein